jgi:hypothetical protein
MKLLMENWREYMEESQICENHTYVTRVLGISLPVNESGDIIISEELRRHILEEHMLLENFIKSVFDNLKTGAGEMKNLLQAFYSMAKDKTGESIDKWNTIIGRLINENTKKLKKALEVASSLPKVGDAANKLLQKLEGALESFFNSPSGWKKVIAGTSMAVGLIWIQKKIGALIDSLASATNPRDMAKEEVIDQVKEFLIGSVTKFFGEDFIGNVMDHATDVKKWLGWIGPLVGGVSFVASELDRPALRVNKPGSLRPFMKKENEEIR